MARERLSIVVCTRERPEHLRRCLAALRPLAAAGHEVIVVDNAPRDEAARAVAARFPCRYLREPVPGLNRARNRGWRAARHALVAFTDDDTVAAADWADALARAFARPGVAAVTGRVLSLELETPAQTLFDLYCAARRGGRARLYTRENLRPAAAGVTGCGANMAFRRDWLAGLGGFDPRLDAGTRTLSGGDTDLLARVLAAGGHIAYTPAAVVWHRHRREMRALRECLFGYGAGLTGFLAKRLLEAGDLHALVIAARWTAGPLVKAAARRLRGQPTLPLSLLLAEAAGACVGPLRFVQEAARPRSAEERGHVRVAWP